MIEGRVINFILDKLIEVAYAWLEVIGRIEVVVLKIPQGSGENLFS